MSLRQVCQVLQLHATLCSMVVQAARGHGCQWPYPSLIACASVHAPGRLEWVRFHEACMKGSGQGLQQLASTAHRASRRPICTTGRTPIATPGRHLRMRVSYQHPTASARCSMPIAISIPARGSRRLSRHCGRNPKPKVGNPRRQEYRDSSRWSHERPAVTGWMVESLQERYWVNFQELIDED
jgi:hypothetical protein